MSLGGISSGGGPQEVDLSAGPATGQSDGRIGDHGGNTIHFTPPKALQQASRNQMMTYGGLALAALAGIWLWKK